MGTDTAPRGSLLVAVSRATNVWHIAHDGANTTLCGRLLWEGQYEVAGPDEYPYPELLAVCRLCQKQEWRVG